MKKLTLTKVAMLSFWKNKHSRKLKFTAFRKATARDHEWYILKKIIDCTSTIVASTSMSTPGVHTKCLEASARGRT